MGTDRLIDDSAINELLKIRYRTRSGQTKWIVGRLKHPDIGGYAIFDVNGKQFLVPNNWIEIIMPIQEGNAERKEGDRAEETDDRSSDEKLPS
jgi:hypothetical protein